MKGGGILTISQKELKKSKDLVEKLLKVNGNKYNDWLHQQHQQFIEENQDLILQALSAFTGEEEEEEKNEPKIAEQVPVRPQSIPVTQN
ncbi:hypothetical protein [Priestia megaterium]|uniref:hypothetical protein n=1 Tax=Priestia megaterium TaxID=1404 RepID=UPI00211D9A81|nr:hypothetical protein [Priestia megaterium]